MIARIGHYALLFSGVLSCLSLLLIVNKKRIGVRLLKTSLCLQFYGILVAFISLVYVFIISDFSVVIVALNSHKLAPLLYRISAAWSTHEGSMLLWALIQTGYGACYALRNHPFSIKHEHRFIIIFNVINLFFLTFIIYTSNPLIALDIVPKTSGRGLNPLLEDISLAIHPPILYMGYVGLIVPFISSLAQSAFPQDKVIWARCMRPWTLFPWFCLTSGIILGSFWAYYELGWGGWWFWDPVENAALIPWLLATGQIHVLIALQKQRKFYNLALILGMLSFLMSVTGTFLARSGIISSIHAFAQDSERGRFILSFIVLLFGYAIFQFLRGFQKTSPIKSLFVREGLLGIQGFTFLVLALLVTLGTFYPLAHQIITQQSITIEPGFYNRILIPLFLLLAVFMGLAAYSRWNNIRSYKQNEVQILTMAVLSSSIFCLIWLLVDTASLLYSLSLGMGIWIILTGCTSFQWKLKQLAMTGAHAAIGLFLIAAAIEQHGLKEKTYIVKQGEEKEFGHFLLIFEKVDYFQAPYFRQEQARLRVKKGHAGRVLKPEKRFYPLREVVTSETALWRRWDGDLYASLGDFQGNDRWAINISWHPMIGLLWLSGFLLSLFGLFAFVQALRVNDQQS